MVNIDKKTCEKPKETLNHVIAASKTVLMTHSYFLPSLKCVMLLNQWHLGNIQNECSFPPLYIWCHLLFINCKDTLRPATMSHIGLLQVSLFPQSKPNPYCYLVKFHITKLIKFSQQVKKRAKHHEVFSLVWSSQQLGCRMYMLYTFCQRTFVVHFVSKYKDRIQERSGPTKHSKSSTKAQAIMG